jgi:hypothetical protein
VPERPYASLSLDLDNRWSYLKTHGDPSWHTYPSYLEVLVPRVLALLAQRSWRITFFVVGQDAAQRRNAELFGAIAQGGHEIGNHSFHHEPWMAARTPERISDELAQAEAAIESATGKRPCGFRGPGFCSSPALIGVLNQRGYAYDASSLPTFIGPLARLYYFASTRLSKEEREERRVLFGGFRDAWRPLRPYEIPTPSGGLLEIPVTTFPGLRVPMHLSYVLYLATFSKALALAYFSAALGACLRARIAPSILLHPLDFLGCDDVDDLGFFPGMRLRSHEKQLIVERAFDMLEQRFAIVEMSTHAHRARPLVRVHSMSDTPLAP